MRTVWDIAARLAGTTGAQASGCILDGFVVDVPPDVGMRCTSAAGPDAAYNRYQRFREIAVTKVGVSKWDSAVASVRASFSQARSLV
ncbi:hypothetical protein [Burkholderia contaminans]|uniref:hypothetical protein n=1 Tax=Burkholderia contaminans TaxID=488447 RepID=UPI0016399870|nr:hypothetical protein [Burkholderia contaminans]